MCDLSIAPTRSAAGQFLPGRSGNPGGRPLGARNKRTILAEMLDDGESAALVRAVVDRALAGDWPALRLCFTRLVAPKKEAPVAFDLPAVATLADVADAGAALLAAVAAGELTPGEGQKMMALLSAQLRILTAAERAREERARAETPAAAPALAVSAPPSQPEHRVAAPQAPRPAAEVRPEQSRMACIQPVFSAVAPSREEKRKRRLPLPRPCIQPVLSLVEGLVSYDAHAVPARAEAISVAAPGVPASWLREPSWRRVGLGARPGVTAGGIAPPRIAVPVVDSLADAMPGPKSRRSGGACIQPVSCDVRRAGVAA